MYGYGCVLKRIPKNNIRAPEYKKEATLENTGDICARQMFGANEVHHVHEVHNPEQKSTAATKKHEHDEHDELVLPPTFPRAIYAPAKIVLKRRKLRVRVY